MEDMTMKKELETLKNENEELKYYMTNNDKEPLN